jgi:murein DD-endopeptidase MepM/ murein hydrolase activator NlpD
MVPYKHFKNRFEREVSAKYIRVLTAEQKQPRLSISLQLRNYVASDSSFLGNVITEYETWVYGFDHKTRVQSSQWKTPTSPRAKKARQSRSNIKVDDLFLP